MKTVPQSATKKPPRSGAISKERMSDHTGSISVHHKLHQGHIHDPHAHSSHGHHNSGHGMAQGLAPEGGYQGSEECYPDDPDHGSPAHYGHDADDAY